MYNAQRMRQYQQQAVASATPEQLVAKLYDFCISACHQDDRSKLRRGLAELMGSIDFEQGGDLANRLYALYEFCLNESVSGDIELVCGLVTELRDAWREGVLVRRAA